VDDVPDGDAGDDREAGGGRPVDPAVTWLTAGLAAVALAVALGLVLVQRVGTTYRDGLDVAAESAALAADGAEPLAAMTVELVAFADVAETGIADARRLLTTTQTSLDQLGVSAREDLAVTTEGLASLADRVSGVIESIERFVPGGSSSAADDLRAIADGLEPVPGQLVRPVGAGAVVRAAVYGDHGGGVRRGEVADFLDRARRRDLAETVRGVQDRRRAVFPDPPHLRSRCDAAGPDRLHVKGEAQDAM
jgi:hypothetical protein